MPPRCPVQMWSERYALQASLCLHLPHYCRTFPEIIPIRAPSFSVCGWKHAFNGVLASAVMDLSSLSFGCLALPLTSDEGAAGTAGAAL